MAQIDIDKFVISLRRCFGENKGIATTLDRCLFSLGLKYVDTPTGGRLERVDQPTMLEKIMWESGEKKPVKVPKFKVGDFIQFNGMGHTRYTVKEVCGLSHYINTCGKRMDMSYTDANFELVENKSAEWSKEGERDFDIIRGIIYNSCNAEDASRLIAWLNELKDRVLPQPKQEWSEADKSNLDSAIYYIRREPYRESDVEPIVEWLRTLKERVQPQPNQEWSEEDKVMLDEIIDFFENGTVKLQHDLSLYASFLKSLRPQNWTKEDKDRYISCLQRLSTGNPEQPETINSKWFKEHVYPQNRWKPSATDIIVLEGVIDRGINPINYHTTLHGILEQLKKLREE